MVADPEKYGLSKEEMKEVQDKAAEKQKGWRRIKNIFKTKHSRTYDLAKKKLAEKLHATDGSSQQGHKKSILKFMGLKENAREKNIKRKL